MNYKTAIGCHWHNKTANGCHSEGAIGTGYAGTQCPKNLKRVVLSNMIHEILHYMLTHSVQNDKVVLANDV